MREGRRYERSGVTDARGCNQFAVAPLCLIRHNSMFRRAGVEVEWRVGRKEEADGRGGEACGGMGRLRCGDV